MDAQLEAVPRESRGKNEARRLRASGKIPAVVYGGAQKAAQAISVDPKELSRILRSDTGENTLINLTTGAEDGVRVMVREYQVDPIKGHLLHADFYRVAMDRVITVTVPVVGHGEAKGVKQEGGVLEVVHREVEIECLPADIPEHFEVDLTDLALGEAVRVKDVVTDARWTPVSDPETMLIHIVAPRVEAEAAAEEEAAEGAEGGEPEVMKKGKEDKEGDESEGDS